MNRYRFLRTKRYPHPDGPKRRAGTVYPVDDATAALWVERGIIAPEETPAREGNATPPAPGRDAPAKSKPRGKPRRPTRSTARKE